MERKHDIDEVKKNNEKNEKQVLVKLAFGKAITRRPTTVRFSLSVVK